MAGYRALAAATELTSVCVTATADAAAALVAADVAALAADNSKAGRGTSLLGLSVALACNLKFPYNTFGVTFYVFKNCFKTKCTLIHQPA